VESRTGCQVLPSPLGFIHLTQLGKKGEEVSIFPPLFPPSPVKISLFSPSCGRPGRKGDEGETRRILLPFQTSPPSFFPPGSNPRRKSKEFPPGLLFHPSPPFFLSSPLVLVGAENKMGGLPTADFSPFPRPFSPFFFPPFPRNRT